MFTLDMKLPPPLPSHYHSPTTGHLNDTVYCDPYANGYVIEGSWHPSFLRPESDRPCNLPFPSDSVTALNESSTLPAHLQNKLILLFGDSFDRYLTMDVCATFTGTEDNPYGNLIGVTLNGTILQNSIQDLLGPPTDFGNGETYICPIKRENGVFVIISVFHYGMYGKRSFFSDSSIHWEPFWSPLLTEERIQWIPHMLKSVAKHAFPSLCPVLESGDIDPVACPDPIFRTRQRHSAQRHLMIPSPPLLTTNGDSSKDFWYPTPDIIVAQSTAWDVKAILADTKGVVSALRGWTKEVSARMVSPFRNVFHARVQDKFVVQNVEGTETREWYPRFFLRTSPPARKMERTARLPRYILKYMNDVIRSGELWFQGEPWGVLDFADFAEEKWRGDEFHPSTENNFFPTLKILMPILNIVVAVVFRAGKLGAVLTYNRVLKSHAHLPKSDDFLKYTLAVKNEIGQNKVKTNITSKPHTKTQTRMTALAQQAAAQTLLLSPFSAQHIQMGSFGRIVVIRRTGEDGRRKLRSGDTSSNGTLLNGKEFKIDDGGKSKRVVLNHGDIFSIQNRSFRMEYPTQEKVKKYLKEHPDVDGLITPNKILESLSFPEFIASTSTLPQTIRKNLIKNYLNTPKLSCINEVQTVSSAVNEFDKVVANSFETNLHAVSNTSNKSPQRNSSVKPPGKEKHLYQVFITTESAEGSDSSASDSQPGTPTKEIAVNTESSQNFAKKNPSNIGKSFALSPRPQQKITNEISLSVATTPNKTLFQTQSNDGWKSLPQKLVFVENSTAKADELANPFLNNKKLIQAGETVRPVSVALSKLALDVSENLENDRSTEKTKHRTAEKSFMDETQEETFSDSNSDGDSRKSHFVDDDAPTAPRTPSGESRKRIVTFGRQLTPEIFQSDKPAATPVQRGGKIVSKSTPSGSILKSTIRHITTFAATRSPSKVTKVCTGIPSVPIAKNFIKHTSSRQPAGFRTPGLVAPKIVQPYVGPASTSKIVPVVRMSPKKSVTNFKKTFKFAPIAGNGGGVSNFYNTAGVAVKSNILAATPISSNSFSTKPNDNTLGNEVSSIDDFINVPSTPTGVMLSPETRTSPRRISARRVSAGVLPVVTKKIPPKANEWNSFASKLAEIVAESLENDVAASPPFGFNTEFVDAATKQRDSGDQEVDVNNESTAENQKLVTFANKTEAILESPDAEYEIPSDFATIASSEEITANDDQLDIFDDFYDEPNPGEYLPQLSIISPSSVAILKTCDVETTVKINDILQIESRGSGMKNTSEIEQDSNLEFSVEKEGEIMDVEKSLEVILDIGVKKEAKNDVTKEIAKDKDEMVEEKTQEYFSNGNQADLNESSSKIFEDGEVGVESNAVLPSKTPVTDFPSEISTHNSKSAQEIPTDSHNTSIKVPEATEAVLLCRNTKNRQIDNIFDSAVFGKEISDDEAQSKTAPMHDSNIVVNFESFTTALKVRRDSKSVSSPKSATQPTPRSNSDITDRVESEGFEPRSQNELVSSTDRTLESHNSKTVRTPLKVLEATEPILSQNGAAAITPLRAFSKLIVYTENDVNGKEISEQQSVNPSNYIEEPEVYSPQNNARNYLIPSKMTDIVIDELSDVFKLQIPDSQTALQPELASIEHQVQDFFAGISKDTEPSNSSVPLNYDALHVNNDSTVLQNSEVAINNNESETANIIPSVNPKKKNTGTNALSVKKGISQPLEFYGNLTKRTGVVESDSLRNSSRKLSNVINAVNIVAVTESEFLTKDSLDSQEQKENGDLGKKSENSDTVLKSAESKEPVSAFTPVKITSSKALMKNRRKNQMNKTGTTSTYTAKNSASVLKNAQIITVDYSNEAETEDGTQETVVLTDDSAIKNLELLVVERGIVEDSENENSAKLIETFSVTPIERLLTASMSSSRMSTRNRSSKAGGSVSATQINEAEFHASTLIGKNTGKRGFRNQVTNLAVNLDNYVSDENVSEPILESPPKKQKLESSAKNCEATSVNSIRKGGENSPKKRITRAKPTDSVQFTNDTSKKDSDDRELTVIEEESERILDTEQSVATDANNSPIKETFKKNNRKRAANAKNVKTDAADPVEQYPDSKSTSYDSNEQEVNFQIPIDFLVESDGPLIGSSEVTDAVKIAEAVTTKKITKKKAPTRSKSTKTTATASVVEVEDQRELLEETVASETLMRSSRSKKTKASGPSTSSVTKTQTELSIEFSNEPEKINEFAESGKISLKNASKSGKPEYEHPIAPKPDVENFKPVQKKAPVNSTTKKPVEEHGIKRKLDVKILNAESEEYLNLDEKLEALQSKKRKGKNADVPETILEELAPRKKGWPASKKTNVPEELVEPKELVQPNETIEKPKKSNRSRRAVESDEPKSLLRKKAVQSEEPSELTDASSGAQKKASTSRRSKSKAKIPVVEEYLIDVEKVEESHRPSRAKRS
ncbi:hypothetical protein HK100_010125 [Physocladia obscura]|uniref:PP1-binding domain-containing protein n=1 Tax=Physocladia obscura TaxID=109957 RepID=A0AAD5T2M7_9FUNG|nr:hypothetical protein HK100_010125 [Physocladia obscura]